MGLFTYLLSSRETAMHSTGRTCWACRTRTDYSETVCFVEAGGWGGERV